MTAVLPDGELVLRGHIMQASNATFLAEVGGVAVVYKPVRGERPLWDFPDGTLANRERSAYLVSEALGWGIVPETVLREGPHGPGMVQRWVDTAGDRRAVDVVPADEVPTGWLAVFDGLDQHDRAVTLVHEDTEALRRMVVLDAIVNNADRKGGHVLVAADGQRHGVDHGVCFHTEDKLRTVLWGWAGLPLAESELDAVRRVAGDAALLDSLGELLTDAEVAAMVHRCTELVSHAAMPLPGEGWPSIPWPPY